MRVLFPGLIAYAVGCTRASASPSSASPSKIYGRAGQSEASLPGTPSHHFGTRGGGAGLTTETVDVASDVLSFTSTNEYAAVTGSPWPHLAEPLKPSTLTASSIVGDSEKDVFKWLLADGTMLEGRSIQHTFTSVGRQKLSLRQTVVSTGQVFNLDDYVMVKFVRREIRQLSQSDREAFFDALETLYRLPTVEGNAMYGDEYKGIDFFVQMHLDGAGVTDCDHWHDDSGIMTHHVGYTLQFEQALQLVNPAVSIPYWEYTIEAAAGLASYGDSEVFNDDWFGEASPENALHAVGTGRWAYLPVMQEAWDYVHNPFGLLRAPWNLDSTPFVTRHNMTNNQALTSMVSCAQYEACFSSSTLADINKCLNGDTHGPVHIIVGGEWNNPEELFIDISGYADFVPILAKIFWRMGYLRIPESCTVEESGVGDSSTCRSKCPVELYKTRGMTPYDVLVDTKALHWVATGAAGILTYIEEEDRFVVTGHEDDEEFQQAFWEKLLASICDPGHVGDLYTSSAPYDPLFWVIHPTAERFLGWRRKLAREHPGDTWQFDETWGYAHGATVGETGKVCDWSNVTTGTLDMPTCSTSTCGGHRALDVLPFKIKIQGEVRKMSNVEWLEFIYPDNEELPYMYNEFSWDHCVEEGYYFGSRQDE